MFKKSLLIALLAVSLSACASDRPKLMGLDGTSVPQAFSHFPDIPFPDSSYVDLGETKALGSGENWTGSLVFTTPYDNSAVFDFYMSEMPKLKWTEVATVRARISHMTYIRSERAVQVLVEDDSFLWWDKSRVTITAIPKGGKYTYSITNHNSASSM
ncbi:MAG: hypothetical protein LBL47_00165 [Lactobacillus sp.]|jgi:hypothetical protein|nr:hypothetical protein [Lactobacillus sp.]